MCEMRVGMHPIVPTTKLSFPHSVPWCLSQKLNDIIYEHAIPLIYLSILHWYNTWLLKLFNIFKSDSINFPRLFFFKIFLTVLSPLHFYINDRISCQFLIFKTCPDYYCDVIESVIQGRDPWSLNNVMSSILQTWGIYLFI